MHRLPTIADQNANGEAGFTLVEILTVLFIIALMSTAVMISMPPSKTALDKQSERMVVQLNALAQDALVTGKVSAAGIGQTGFVFYRYENAQWTEKYAENWDGSYRVKFERESVAIELPETITPSLLFYPTGQSTIFDISISDGKAEQRLVSSGNNKISKIKIAQ